MSEEDEGARALSQQMRTAETVAVDVAIRLGFIAIFLWFSLQLIAPFVGLFIWAVILTVAAYPMHVWLRARLGGRGGLSALILTLIPLAIILGPAAALAIGLAENMQNLVASIEAGTLKLPPPPDGLREWPLVGPQLDDAWRLLSSNLVAGIAKFKDPIISFATAALGQAAGLGGGVLLFAISIIISGFLYGPGPAMAENARRFASRVAAPHGAEFVDMAGATIRNVSRGVIGVSLIQAILAGIGLSVAGVPAAGAIAFAVLILGIVQIGPAIVIIPVVIWSWTSMDTLAAGLFTAWMIPVMIMDNFLKPVLMARGLRTPMLVIFAGVVGGTFVYGLIGLFLGPVVLAVFYELLTAWVRMDAGEDAGAEEGDGGEPA